MVIKQIYNTPNNNQLLITLPNGFTKKKRIMVVIDDSVDKNVEKIELLKKASSDKLFKADIEDVFNDFNNVDFETL